MYRNLKSILKKLSEDTAVVPAAMPERIDSTEFRKLMRAPTIEGYAARHSKLSKSVTFNRDTLQSPPNSANLINAPQNLFPIVKSPTGDNENGGDNMRTPEDERRQEWEEKCSIQLIATKTNQVKLHKGETVL